MTIFFLVEYAARLWVAPEWPQMADMSPTMARLRWATSLSGLIGVLAVMPAVMLAGGYSIVGADAASVFCILWIMKLGLHAPAFGTLARVISNERAPIASVLIVFAILLMSAATGAHIVERAGQPQQFGSLPNAMWWSVVTLTTTGYGDVVPLTPAGRIIGSLLMISGIAVLALMTGVLATGFAQEERRREYLRVWDQVTRVPIFASLGIVTPLRDRGQAAHALLPRARHRAAARRSRRSRCSSSPAARSRCACPPAARSAWAMAPSSARCRCSIASRVPQPIATTAPTTLLVLYASDFYEIASHIPALAEAVENEARRRREENSSARRAPGGSKS